MTMCDMKDMGGEGLKRIDFGSDIITTCNKDTPSCLLQSIKE